MLKRVVRPGVLGGAGAVVAAGFLLWRIAPDVRGKPFFEDEAIAGLTAARPVGELLATVVWDRGGAPLHFLLAHGVFSVDASGEALRWISVLFALGAVLLTYELGRRLDGAVAGVVAAFVAASSTVLAIYGSFGRMYSLFAFAAALSGVLFVRALELRTPSASAAASAAAWLLPAIHPYGVFPLGAEALVGLWLWRGRPFRAGLPVLAIALATIPFAIADLRLADRFTVGAEGDRALAPPDEAWRQLGRAIASFAGGDGLTLFVLVLLAAVGFVAVARSRAPVAAVAAISLLAPPLLFMVVRSGSGPILSPRHLVYGLPFWAAFVGVGLATLTRSLGDRGRLAAVALFAVLTISAGPGGLDDPRDAHSILGGGRPAEAAPGHRTALAAPARWLRREVRDGDVLYPYSPAFLAALPRTRAATSLPYGQPETLLRALRRADWPVPGVVIAVPLPGGSSPTGDVAWPSAHLSSRWFLYRLAGPYSSERALLRAARRSLARLGADVTPGKALELYLIRTAPVLCEALRSLGERCP